MDMGASFNKSVRAEGHAPQAVICIDPFHAVKLVTEALDTVRRVTWNELRALPDQAAAKKFKGARWALLKRPENLTDEQSAKLRRRGGDLWRAYSLKEAFRKIFAGDLDAEETTELLDRWCSKASRSRLPAFVKVAKTIRKFRDGILAAIRLGVNNAPRRRTQQPPPPDHPTRLRLPLRQGRSRPGHALLRAHRAAPTSREIPGMIHIGAERAMKIRNAVSPNPNPAGGGAPSWSLRTCHGRRFPAAARDCVRRAALVV